MVNGTRDRRTKRRRVHITPDLERVVRSELQASHKDILRTVYKARVDMDGVHSKRIKDCFKYNLNMEQCFDKLCPREQELYIFFANKLN